MSFTRLSVTLVVAVFVVAGGCRLATVVGSVDCTSSHDCSPPATVCGVDSRCVTGCTTSSCVGGATCNSTTGECAGGLVGASCASDTDCDPPEIACAPSTGTCAATCTLTGVCPTGLACDHNTGHCCDPDDPACTATMLPTISCTDDSACGAPAQICTAGRCVAGCTGTSCTAPQTCETSSGHCVVPSCLFDADCDAGSFCTQAGTCQVLTDSGPGTCNAGTTVSYPCATEDSAKAFASCVGTSGPGTCRYCLDTSCFDAGLCESASECHHGSACTQGLCIPSADPCPTTVPIADIVAGDYSVGKELCVRARVSSVRSGYDGAIEVKLGTLPYLYVDALQMYQSAGLMLPTAGDTVTIHGKVRWDESHGDWELFPVDWVGP